MTFSIEDQEIIDKVLDGPVTFLKLVSGEEIICIAKDHPFDFSPARSLITYPMVVFRVNYETDGRPTKEPYTFEPWLENYTGHRLIIMADHVITKWFPSTGLTTEYIKRVLIEYKINQAAMEDSAS